MRGAGERRGRARRASRDGGRVEWRKEGRPQTDDRKQQPGACVPGARLWRAGAYSLVVVVVWGACVWLRACGTTSVCGDWSSRGDLMERDG